MTNVAFIGLKGHQSVALEAIPELPDMKIVAVADDDPESLKRVSDFPGATKDTKTFLDYRELLKESKPDIVVEAGIDRDRVETLIACAERGIHFLCEKPLAKDLSSLERLREAVVESGVIGSVLFTMRGEPPYIVMRSAVRSGQVGVITQGGGQKSYRLGRRPAWQKSHETFSGIIPFIGIHLVDLLTWVTGLEYLEVMAYASNLGHPEMGDMEDNACILARMSNGASTAFRLDFCRPEAAPTHGDDRLRVAGNKGVIEVRDGWATLITHEEGPTNLPPPRPVNLFASLVEAIEQKSRPYIPFEEALRSTEIVLRAQESASLGRPIKING